MSIAFQFFLFWPSERGKTIVDVSYTDMHREKQRQAVRRLYPPSLSQSTHPIVACNRCTATSLSFRFMRHPNILKINFSFFLLVCPGFLCSHENLS
jgi:hypothetical protein